MFQPQPAAPQRRHRRLPSGTMVSYAEVKNYLSKREIPQLFESLMAGLMYHRPENHIGYLQTCLDEVKSNSETKVHWSTFVNKKRKSKEILPPLTPKKQDSFSSSWSDNSRQSTPLPPISARTRTRTSTDQQDLRNTYILYHNPPPILAKPKVPVVSVLGGLGSRIDELCEKVVGRLRGVVHISTCSMLKTRMTIEGFYRVTSVPACAVVDSVLQAMSMVQSANALLVAGFPRNRGDIEEYRSRRVRMDGVVLVDFEEDSLRHFLNSEVSSGALRVSDIETELDRYKQDIISVAEYYDEKELLTVVMGDQDTEEMVEDMVIAVDKIIETRKDIGEDDSIPDSKGHDCSTESPCKALVPSPNGLERPSTVEIREATEEDIRSIEAESRNSKRDEDGQTEETPQTEANEEVVQDESKVSEDGPKETEGSQVTEEIAQNGSKEENGQKDEQTSENGSRQTEDVPSGDKVSQNSSPNEDLEEDSKADEGSDAGLGIVKEAPTCEVSQAGSEHGKTETDSAQSGEVEQTPKIPILFAFENIKTDCEVLKELIVNEIGMCYINFLELIRNDGAENDRLGSDESLNLLQSVLQQDSVSYSSGFFISDFPFDLLKESRFDKILKLGEVSFVCKVKEKSFETEVDEKPQPEEVLFESAMSEKVRIIFVTDSNIMEELKSSLQEIVSNRESRAENSIEEPSDAENNSKTEGACQESDLEKPSAVIDKEEKVEAGDEAEGDSTEKPEALPASDKEADGIKSDNAVDINNSQNEDEENSKNGDNGNLQNGGIAATNVEAEEVNQDSITTDKTSRDDNEDSTCQDIDDLITDDTLNERTKPSDSLQTEGNEDVNPKETVTEDSISQITEEGALPVAASKDKAVLERQQNLDLETTSASDSSTQLIKDQVEPSNGNAGNDETSKAKSPLIRQGTFLSTHETTQNAEVETEETNQEVSETAQEGEVTANTDEEPQGESKEEIESTEANDSGTADGASKDSHSADENKNTASVEEQQNEPAEDEHSEGGQSAQNGDNTDQNEVNEENADQIETHNAGDETVTADSEKDHEENKNEEIPEIDNQAIPENPVEETVTSAADESDKSASDGQEDKKSDLEHEETEAKPENEETEAKPENEETEAKPENEETEAKPENEEENAVDQEVDDKISDTKDDENSNKSENVPENEQEEPAGDEGGNQQEVSGEKNEECGNSATAEDDSSKREDNSNEGEANGEPNDDTTASTEDTESEENSQEVSVKEAEKAKDDKSEVAVNSNEESADKTDGEEHATTVHEEAAENKDAASTAVLKSMDNDSDSNDENGDKSITIETQAEVHAPDSESPPLVEDSVETNTDNNNSTASHVAETAPETADASNDEEKNNNEQKDSIGDDGAVLEKELTFENTDESQVTSGNEITIRNESYSGKHQERNGSGILGDSRQEDQPDAEQQERSSSSSRGEL